MISTIETDKLFANYEVLAKKIVQAEKNKEAKKKTSGTEQNYEKYKYTLVDKEFKLANQAHIAMNYGIDE